MGTFQRMIVMTALAMLALVTLTVLAPEKDLVVIAADTPSTPQLTNLHMYMEDSTGMSPEPPDRAVTEMTATIPNGFVQDGPFGKGWLPVMGHVYWRDVGTWYTDPVKNTINLGGSVEVTMYVKGNPENGAINCDFIFTISRSGESTPILQMDVMNVRIPAGTEEPVKFTTSSAFPPTNDTTINAGTAMALRIQARCSGGGTLLYGSDEYNSGFTFAANSLIPYVPFIREDGAGLEYKDAFLVPWMKLTRKMTVNNVPMDNSKQTTEINSANQTRVLFWPTIFGPGSYDIVVSLCYDETGWGNVSSMSSMKISIVTEPFVKKAVGWFWSNIWWVIVIALVIVSALAYRVQRKKVWRRRVRTLPAQDQKLPFRKQKKAWTARYKEEVRLRHEAKLVRRRQMEDEEAQMGFRLFKRKGAEAKAPRTVRSRRSSAAPQAQAGKRLSLDEIKELDLDL